MTVTPTALAPWIRNASLEDLGGHTSKKNQYGIGEINPETDVSAEQFSSLVEFALAAQRVMPFAVLTYTQDDTGTSNPTASAYFAQPGNGTDFAPTLTRLDDGYVQVDFSASYNDSYSRAATFSISHYKATAHGSTPAHAMCELIDPQTLLVRCFDNDGYSAVLDATVTLEVW